MAIYHCSLRVFTRSKGHSAVAAAAYRAGAKLKDERSGRTHRYEHRKGVIDAFLLLPVNAPDGFNSRAVLWNAAEDAEKRKNSCVARELILALPHELSKEDRHSLTKDLGLWLVDRYGVAADIAIHAPVAGDGHDERNHHAHLLFSTRELTPAGFGKKTRILDDKVTGKAETELIREVWETLANEALRNAGHSDVQIDRRSLEEQGIDRIPQTHIGPKALAAAEADDSGDEEEGGTDDSGGGRSSAGAGGGSQQGGSSSGDDKGSGDKSGSGDGAGGFALKPKKGKAHEVGYLVIDAGRSRYDFVQEIKALNERRSTFSAVPLDVQIEQINNLIDRLDHRVGQYKTLQARTSLPEVVNKLVIKAVKFGTALLTARQQSRAAAGLNRQERRARVKRQQGRYGRTYRRGVQQQIRDMKQNLETLEQLSRSYQKYKGFIDQIDQEILKHSPSIITATERTESKKPSKIVTNMESSLKLKLTAQMIRETIPAPFKPKSDTPAITPKQSRAAPKDIQKKTPQTQNKSTETHRIETTTYPLQSNNLDGQVKVKYDVSVKGNPERRAWFIKGGDDIRPFADAVNQALDELEKQQPMRVPDAAHDLATLKGLFNSRGSPMPISPKASYETVKERVRVEAIASRKRTPKQYRVEPYSQAGPLSKQKMSGRFNKAASEGENGQSKPDDPLPEIT